MPTTCDIYFENNPFKIIYTDQFLRGVVISTLTSSKKVRGIFLKITGKGHTHWIQGFGKQRQSFRGDEEYLYEKMPLAGGIANRGKRRYFYIL